MNEMKDIVSLRPDFEIARGELARILDTFRGLNMSYRCGAFHQLLDKHVIEALSDEDSTVTRDLGRNDVMRNIAKSGLLVDVDGHYELADNVGDVLLAMAGFKSLEAYQAAKEEGNGILGYCPPWQFEPDVLAIES